MSVKKNTNIQYTNKQKNYINIMKSVFLHFSDILTWEGEHYQYIIKRHKSTMTYELMVCGCSSLGNNVYIMILHSTHVKKMRILI